RFGSRRCEEGTPVSVPISISHTKNALRQATLKEWQAAWRAMSTCRQSKLFVPNPYLRSKILKYKRAQICVIVGM
ncbi:Hypothetical protein FKW44_009269, partial [Caligus rogercresseyi]